MNSLILIFNSVYGVVVSCFHVIDIDLFGIGFTVLDFFISILIISLVFSLLGKSLDSCNRFNLLHLVGYDVGGSIISNNSRQQQLLFEKRKDIVSRNNSNYYSSIDFDYDVDSYDWLNR